MRDGDLSVPKRKCQDHLRPILPFSLTDLIGTNIDKEEEDMQEGDTDKDIDFEDKYEIHLDQF